MINIDLILSNILQICTMLYANMHKIKATKQKYLH
jgi:hypothetical protein